MNLKCITGNNAQAMSELLKGKINEHVAGLLNKSVDSITAEDLERAEKGGALIYTTNDVVNAENDRDVVSAFIQKIESALSERTKDTKRAHKLLIVMEATEDAFDAIPRFYKLNMIQNMMFIGTYGKEFNTEMICTFDMDADVREANDIEPSTIVDTLFHHISGFVE